MPAPSLVAICTKACINNVRSLTDVGDFEYWKIRTVLLRVTSPEQLHQIELASPQICGEDEELWRKFIARDIPDWERKNYAPKNPVRWYDVYMKYKKEQKKEIERDKEKLREAMAGLKKEKETHVSKVVDSKHLPRLPKDPRMLSNNGGVPISGRKRALAKPGASFLSFAGGSKTKMTDPASIMSRARKEAREISARNKLGKPTHKLEAISSRVPRAPDAMVERHRTAAMQLRIYTSKKKTDGAKTVHGSISSPSLEERERRLRALTMTTHVAEPTLVGSDFEDECDEDPDGLFGEKNITIISAPPTKQYHRQETQHMPHSTSMKPLQASSQVVPKPSQTPVKASPESNPSGLISSIISTLRTDRAHSGHGPPESKSSPPQPKTATPPSPTANPIKAPIPKPPMMTKRKREVDIFNRTAGAPKRPRV